MPATIENGPAATRSTSNNTLRNAGATASAPAAPAASPSTIGRAASPTMVLTF